MQPRDVKGDSASWVVVASKTRRNRVTPRELTDLGRVSHSSSSRLFHSEPPQSLSIERDITATRLSFTLFYLQLMLYSGLH